MTKQEAIKVLKKDLKIIDDPNVTMTASEWEEHDDHMRDALEMAIEALEKEETLQNLTKPNKSDLISRQAAIDALYDKGLSMTAWGELLAMKWSDIQTCIELLPSAQPFTEEQIQTMQELESAQIEKAYELGKADRPKWIPCSRRLPEEGDVVLICSKIGVIDFGKRKGDKWVWLAEALWDYWQETEDLIAWMPLPEPYREDGEEE